MQTIKNILNLDNLSCTFSVLVLSIVVSLATSLFLLGRIDYFVVSAVVIIYSLIAFKTFKPVTNFPDCSKAKFDYSIVVVLGALCMGLLLYGNQFEYSSIWGDIGVYINAASHLRDGGEIPFKLARLGLDLATNTELKPPFGIINPAGEGLWQFHGLPIWPAFMAVSQLPSDGLPVLAILFSINIILFFTVANCFARDEKAAALATLLFASIPLVWHQALYATSEMLLLSIFLSSLVLSFKFNLKPVHLCFGLFAYGVTHTGILILSPAIGLALFVLALLANKTVRSKLVLSGLFCAIASLLAYQFSQFVSMKYTQDITISLFGKRTYLAYIACLSPLLTTVPFIVERLAPNIFVKTKRISKWFYRHFNLLAAVILVCLLVIFYIKSYRLGWTNFYMPAASPLSKFNSWAARQTYINKGVISLYHLSIFNILLASGGLGLISFILIPFYRRISLRNKLMWLFSLIFVFVFGVYRIDIPNNYYASRYFLPILVPCLLILSATMIKIIPSFKYIIIPIVALSFFFNSATVGSGFFLGDNYLKNYLQTNIGGENSVTLYGSDWLSYMAYPFLLKRNVDQSSVFARVPDHSKDSTRTSNLVTDSKMVLGGDKKCIEYIERRIPWQIIYPTSPELLVRNVSIFTPSEIVSKTLELTSNQWINAGQFNFVLVRPKNIQHAKIKFNSLGWWASKAPFLKNENSLNPHLNVCGTEFTVESILPHEITFQGRIPNEFCIAKFITETFVPHEIGEGNDMRSLGIDIHSISISPVL